MATSTTLNNSASISQYWFKKALDRLVANTPLYNMAQKETLVEGNGKIANWVRFGNPTADTTPINEGQIVSAQSLSSQNITATVQQYGNAYVISDMFSDTSFVENGPEFQAMSVAETQMQYTANALLQNAINSSTTTFGSNLFAAAGVAAIGSLVATNVLTGADIRKYVARLNANNVPKFDGGLQAVVIGETQAYDVLSDSSTGGYIDLLKQTSNTKEDINQGLLGQIFGAKVFRSSLQPVSPDGSAGVQVTYAYFIGKGGLGAVELSSQRMKVIRKKGGNNILDPIDQIAGVVGYKMAFAGVNLSETPVQTNNQRILRVGSATTLA